MIRDRIFELLDKDDGILVFPTENTARYYLAEYVREHKCSLLGSRAMAFDRLREEFMPSREGLEAVTPYHRLAFAASFLEENAASLRYFYNPSYPESLDRFVSFFSSILPSLERFGGYLRSKELYHDLEIISSAYRSFLSLHGLYEPGECDYKPKSTEEKYYLIAFTCESNMQRFYEDLGKPDFLVPVPLEEESEVPLHLFENESAELSFIFSKLESLLGSSVSYDDIILSSPDIVRLRPYLEREAAERGILLDFVSDIPLSESVPGRYLTLLETMYREKFSFSSLERFLLSSAFPFTSRVRKLGQEIIRAMIDHGVESCGLDFSAGGMKYILSEDAYEMFMVIRSSVLSLSDAKDGAAVERAIHRLNTFLFESEEFSSDPSDRDRFSFILSSLSSFSRLVTSLSLKLPSFYSLFLWQLRRTTYNLEEGKKGIKVYTYGQDYLLDVPYHFVFALSAGNTVREEKELPFLEEYEISERRVISATDPMLGAYRSLSRDTFLSSSSSTYDGASSPPFLFISKGALIKEEAAGDGGRARLEKLSFAQGYNTAFNPPSKGEDMGEGHPIPISGKPVLSYTSLSSYEKCPFAEGANVLFSIGDGEDTFEPAITDHKEIGKFLHSVMETFLERHKGTPFKAAEEEACTRELQDIFQSSLSASYKFDQYTKDYINSAFFPSLGKFMKELNGKLPGFTFLKAEKRLLCEADDHILKGFADTVGSSQGVDVIIDYKKGTAEKEAKSYQLLLYGMLLGKEEARLCYFSFKDGIFKDSKADKERMLDAIEAAVEGYREGIWTYTEDKENCKGCASRSICRRRFQVR